MNISSGQAEAAGGVQSCKAAGTPPATSASAPAPPPAVLVADPSKPGWIGIELKTRAGAAAAGEAFEIEEAGGKVIAGKLDPNGKVRVEGVDPGTCKVRFPERDAREWRSA